jgi:hypothetical protein
MSLVITGDECWVYGYDPKTKQMSSQWSTSSSPRPKKADQVKSNIKTMLIAFFDIDGPVHHEFVPTGQTENKEFYETSLLTSQWSKYFKPLLLLFKTLLHGQKDCVFSAGV